jgi:hypothetical protein
MMIKGREGAFTQMQSLFFFLALLVMASDAFPAEPIIVQCHINASADRSHDSKHKWIGRLPKYGKAPDRSIIFEISKGGMDSGFIFANLDTEAPSVRPVMSWKKGDSNAPEIGVESKARVFRRAEGAIFFSWEFGPNEFYTAVLHLPSRKTAITQISTCRAGLCDVGIKAITADCQ